MCCYCFAINQLFFKRLIYSELLKKLKIFLLFIWISTGNMNLVELISVGNSLFEYKQNRICHKAHNQRCEDVPPVKSSGKSDLVKTPDQEINNENGELVISNGFVNGIEKEGRSRYGHYVANDICQMEVIDMIPIHIRSVGEIQKEAESKAE